MQEQELFQHYELKNWDLSPRIYKILGISAIANIFLFVALAQANFLTSKSCDSLVVSGVCSVLDTIYVGSMILDTDTGYVNEEYVKTELEDADITFIDLSGQTPPLEYPAGYFAVANPDQEVSTISNFNPTTPGTFIPGITGNTNPTLNNGMTDITTIPQVTPTPNKNPVVGRLPKGISTNPTTITRNRDKVNKTNPTTTTENQSSTTTENQTTAQTNNQNVKSEPVKEVEINKKPFEDLGDSLNGKVAKNQLDLNKNFLVVMNGSIMADGKLDKKNSNFIRSEGDEQMVNAAKEAIEAVGDSGILGYLKVQGIDTANLTLVQDDNQIYIQLISDMKDVNKANSTASGLNTSLQGLIALDKNGIKRMDDNTKLLVNNATVTSDGKNFVLVVKIPKTDAQAMINKSLKDRAEKKNKQQNSNIESKGNTNSQTAKK